MQFQIELSRLESFWGQPTVQFRVGLSRFGSFLGVWGRPCCADCGAFGPLEVPGQDRAAHGQRTGRLAGGQRRA